MAASSLLLRSIVLASSHRALYPAGSLLHPTSFLQLRIETLSFRRSHLSYRSFSAQVLEVSEPVSETRRSKTKISPAASWEEAGAAFFSKKGKNAAEGNSVEQTVERKGFSAPERVQNRSSQRYVEEEPLINRNLQRKNDRVTNSFSDSKLGNSRSAPRDFGRGRGGLTGRNGSFARRESTVMDSGSDAHQGRGFREELSDAGDNDRGRRWNARSDADGGNRSNARSGADGRNRSNARSDADGGNRWNTRSGADGRNRWNARSDADGGNRWNARGGADGRNQWNARTDTGSRGVRDGYANNQAASRSEGAFRKEFGDSVDSSKSFFRNRNQGGTFGKKQFPDVDGGKRLFKGRFEGDGFVKKQMHGNEGRDDGNGRNKSFGNMKGGQLVSNRSSGAQVQKQSEDDPEAEASSEDDEDDNEDFPQAGDVIRYEEMVGASRERNRRQSPLDTNDNEDELQDKNEAQLALNEDEEEEEDIDVDDDVLKGGDFRSTRRELPVMSSSLPRIVGEVVYGVGPIYAALQVSRREFFCLYVQKNMPISGGKRKDKKAVEWIIRTAVDRGLEVKEVSKHDLNMLADNRPHQGLILDASPLELIVSTHLEAPFGENGKDPVWVALDEVTDPQNFGAILRSAYFLGAKGVVVCAKNSAPLSAVVSKASAGALEVMELRSCKNMIKFLNRSSENGWRAVGGSAAGTGITSVRELPRGFPTILVVGGEGKGLRTNIKRSCSELVCIPGLASESQGKRGSLPNKDVDMGAEDNARPVLRGAGEDFIAVDSLNVSVAAGILLHELLNNQAATECSTKKHSEIDVEEVLNHEQVQISENDAEAVLGDEQEQHSESDVDAVWGDEQEQHLASDVDAMVGDELEQHSASDAEAVPCDEQEQHSESNVAL
ncbi:hypothetical protein GOP47_0030409 [Adiantum capillus-veneris]|nr:hypothetical protein GOP47_0030409 [Adiantum capillus-veneris]